MLGYGEFVSMSWGFGSFRAQVSTEKDEVAYVCSGMGSAMVDE